MTAPRRFMAAVLTAAAVLVLLSSSAFLLLHADHDCAGEDCQICEQLYACTQNFKKLTAVLTAVAAVITFFAFAWVVSRQTCAAFARNTPVDLKVKLSN